MRELLGPHDIEVEIVGNAPGGPVAVAHPLVQRLREVGSLEVRPKQAWTPVAEFGLSGVHAVNCGPGDPSFAHQRTTSRSPRPRSCRSYDVLRAFLEGATEGEGRGTR